MNDSTKHTDTQVDSMRAALPAGHQAERTANQDGMQHARLHDADGNEIGTLFYSIAEENFGPPRIVYAEPISIQTAWGCPNSFAEEVAAERLRDIVVQKVGRSPSQFTYLCWGVKPDDPRQQSLWRKIDAKLGMLMTPATRIRRLEAWSGCAKRARELAASFDVEELSVN